jgi:hypothetical protein
MFGFCLYGLDLGPLFCCCFWGALFIGVYQGIISISPWEKTKKQKGQKLITSSKEKKIQGKEGKTWW